MQVENLFNILSNFHRKHKKSLIVVINNGIKDLSYYDTRFNKYLKKASKLFKIMSLKNNKNCYHICCANEQIWEMRLEHNFVYIRCYITNTKKIYHSNQLYKISNSNKSLSILSYNIINSNKNTSIYFENYDNFYITYFYKKNKSYVLKHLFYFTLKNKEYKYKYIYYHKFIYKKRLYCFLLETILNFQTYLKQIIFVPNKYELNYYSNLFNLII